MYGTEAYMIARGGASASRAGAILPEEADSKRGWKGGLVVTNHSGGRKRGCTRGGTEVPYTTLASVRSSKHQRCSGSMRSCWAPLVAMPHAQQCLCNRAGRSAFSAKLTQSRL